MKKFFSAVLLAMTATGCVSTDPNDSIIPTMDSIAGIPFAEENKCETALDEMYLHVYENRPSTVFRVGQAQGFTNDQINDAIEVANNNEDKEIYMQVMTKKLCK
ncbi:hypothetical protein MADA3029_980007 [Vibrio nigripulchritudo MADA3029]|uniref:Lipoprotein n=2 Tax=Vibrio nigripulchritudo TaxID=28173 RepID=U4K8V3_9VIBR|nr:MULTISPECIES: hypothetical protein [Vibrio]UAB73162.1 hypothetical protein INR79_18490 [Vibrio sp. SCSIO 43132]CCN34357.1 hypothetical protein VIBNIAM115_1460007 [Vibrio nigripulchritudo AM115]CCN43051.1 hypothetical protein VIBNIFTn2_440022 [Vibrio nigripulchritudo FTn2]CCN46497.1 hypothetical protein VIBNIMADA3020_1340007 [Vibrio nigripulchritudo MADA3020]CCN53928.1 hypothetical protein VIBNIMADA3021_450037 [Vibrio nigripulchritudo MADA3021]